MRFCFAALAFFLVGNSSVLAAGHAYSDNFSVLTPRQAAALEEQRYAEGVLQQAERFRKELALEWFGEELPPGVGRAIINVRFTAEDSALTWPVNNPRLTHHMVYLSMAPDRAAGSSLQHELVHVLFATRFPHPTRLPSWLEEGIASRYDDADRIRHRRELVEEYVRRNDWPGLSTFLVARGIHAGNFGQYAVAESLVEFLLTRGDKRKLIEFAESTTTGTLTDSLQAHYGIGSVSELDQLWRQWVVGR